MIAREDATRFGRLQLAPADELRIAGACERWLKILLAEARKHRDAGGVHPSVVTEPVPGHDMQRIVRLD